LEDNSVRSTQPEMADKLQMLETQIIPVFGEAYRKLADLAERIGYSLPPSPVQPETAQTTHGYLQQLAISMDDLRGIGDSLNCLIDELNRFI